MFAANTDAANQPLGDDRFNGGGQQEGLHAQVGQTKNGAGSVIGVHRREDQVARQRSLNRNLSGFKVANLTNQDDVRILSKEGPQQLGERQFLIRIDLALNETINVVFNGILSRQNFGLRVIEFIEAGVQRGGLA